ncbi:hypothetical protein LCGC14_0833270 [marine sediment metagenome]|uniref:Uncharacterized protein n=1 Tax=marine sediment metagenome TaxID=412755 RepID=A0A0F9Q0H3_9ZZZZ
MSTKMSAVEAEKAHTKLAGMAISILGGITWSEIRPADLAAYHQDITEIFMEINEAIRDLCSRIRLPPVE